MKRRSTIVDEAIRATVLPQRVGVTLASFKASVDAYAVAAFDGWQGTARLPSDESPSAQPWDAVGKLACLGTDWTVFKVRLFRHGESEIACRCGAHFLSAFLIRYRWSLMVLGRQSLITPPSELLPLRTTTIETLARILPELDKGEAPLPGDPRGGGNGGAAPAELGIPLWWIRGNN